MKCWLRGWLCFILCCVCFKSLYSQSNSPSRLLLEDYINALQKKHHVTFSFDNDLLKEIAITADTSGLTFEQAIKVLNQQSAFYFQKIDSFNVLVNPIQPGANIKLCGTIVDQRSQTQLPAVYIYNDLRTIGLLTNANGSFSTYTNLNNGGTLHFQMLGYKSIDLTVSYFNGHGCPTIGLSEDTMEVEPVVINAYMGSGINYNFKDNSIEVKPGVLGLLPGETDADILTAIDALPGINTPDSKAGNLNIRGSTPDQTLYVYDNIPIYHKGHYFGTLSPYNAAIVDNVVVQRGPYTADKGGRVGGAIEISSKNFIPDSMQSGVSLSTVNASAFTHLPIVKKKLGLLLGGRASYPSSFVSPKLQAINDFIYQVSSVDEATRKPTQNLDRRVYDFYDLNGKLMFHPGKKDEVSLSFLRISNHINLEISNYQLKAKNKNTMNLKNTGYSALWIRKWNQRVSSKMIATQSYYSQAYTSNYVVAPDTIYQDAKYNNSLNDINGKLITDFLLSEKSTISVGYDLRYQSQEYLNDVFNLKNSSTYINQPRSSYLHAFFANYVLTSSNRYILNAGLRSNYYTLAHNFRIEPRINGSYFVNDYFTLKSSAGIFNQYVMQVAGESIVNVGGIENLLWLLADGNQIPIQRSKQVMAGGIYKRNRWIVDLELYYKDINDITIRNIYHPSLPQRYIYGSEQTVGADLLIKKQWKRVDAWVSYTLSKSTFDFDSIKSTAFAYINDQTHILDLVATYSLKQFKFSAGWKFRSGLPALIGIRPRYMHGGEPTEPNSVNSTPTPPLGPPPGGPGPGGPGPGGPGGPGQPPPPGGPPQGGSPTTVYDDRFPMYHQLDLSIVYIFPKKKHSWNGSIGLSLQNVYNRKNIIEQIPTPAPTGPGLIYMNKYALGFAPNLVLSIQW